MTPSERPSARLRLVRELEELARPLAKCDLPAPTLKTQREKAVAELHEMVRATCRHLIYSGQYSQNELAREMECSAPFLLEALRGTRPVMTWMIMMLPHAGKVELSRRLSQIGTRESVTGT